MNIHPLSDFENLEIGYMYLYLAYFYNNIKNYNKVILLWNELINRRIVPGFDSWGYIMLGNSYLEIDNKTEARDCYNWVLKNSNIENHKSIAKEKLSKL
jgi:tetratricopeptide (TPR) repeat protein